MAHDSTVPRATTASAVARAGVCEVAGWGRFALGWTDAGIILLGLPDRAPGEHLGRVVGRGAVVQSTSAVPETFRTALEAFCAGDPGPIAAVPIAQQGTPFQRDVWDALRAVPSGQTVSYGAIAAAVGRPQAVRAVGQACGANRCAIAVPCHRIIGGDGSRGGFAAGVEWKRRLLEHEMRIRARRDADAAPR